MEILQEIKNIITKSPLISSAANLLRPDSNISLLISCCNMNGGLFYVRFSQNEYSYKKIFNGDCRGIAEYKNGYVLASNNYGILLLDHEFKIIKQFIPECVMDYHGVAIYNNHAYIVETASNTIGIYRLPSLVRVDEIVFENKDEDILHINDIFIQDGLMYLSMFSYGGRWRDKPIDSGVIISIPLNDFSKKEIIISHLKNPHSVKLADGKIIYCNSSEFEAAENGNCIFKSMGYLRGIEKVDNTYFIGQSELRKVPESMQDKRNVSIDAGLHVFNIEEKICRFFKLPVTEIYSIVGCSGIKIKNTDYSEKIIPLNCQLFIDTGNHFSELESIRHSVNPGKNNVRFDVSKFSNIQALRFDPVDTRCIAIIKSMTIKTKNGVNDIVVLKHNASFIKDNIYYFEEHDPQIYLSNTYSSINSVQVEFQLITGSKEMQDYLINIYEEEKRKVFEPGNQNLV